MAESVNGGSGNPATPPKKEMSMEVRLLLAFLLMGVVMFVTPYFFKSQQPQHKIIKRSGNVSHSAGWRRWSNQEVLSQYFF